MYQRAFFVTKRIKFKNRSWYDEEQEEDDETPSANVDRFESQVIRFRRYRLRSHRFDRQEGFVGLFDFPARFRIHRNQEIVVPTPHTSSRSGKRVTSMTLVYGTVFDDLARF